jgi:hypothetical protein
MTDQLDLLPSTSVPSGSSDDWFTPMDLFAPLHTEFQFTVDVAPHADAPATQRILASECCERVFSWTEGLTSPWSGRVWCNPPFSSCAHWLAKADDEMRAKRGPELLVMLIPATRTEQPFWQRYVEPLRDRSPPRGGFTLTTHFLQGRPKFGFPGDPDGEASASPRFGCVLLVWKRRT